MDVTNIHNLEIQQVSQIFAYRNNQCFGSGSLSHGSGSGQKLPNNIDLDPEPTWFKDLDPDPSALIT